MKKRIKCELFTPSVFHYEAYERSENNERLPFDQIQIFIDRCCPDKTILKKVALKLDHIIFR